MSISYKTPSHFSGFSCLGDQCEDTCCRDWEVKLDREHYEVLETVMSKDNVEKSVFEQYIHLNDKLITGDHDYAFIRMGVKGYCAMLDEKGLCSLHAKYGVDVLGNVCTMFPRVISRCMNTVELSGALSCPEVVRSCIDDQKPLKLKRFKTSELPRSKNYPIQRDLMDVDDDVYSENFKLVRDNIMSVMANEEHDLETRLYVLANIADKISGFYYRGCDKFSNDDLKLTLSELSNDSMMIKLGAFIKDYDANTGISMVVVHSILSIKLQQASDENISQLYEKIINQYVTINGSVAEELSEKLNEINSQMAIENKNYIDKAITRYIINCLYREWFVTMPDLFTYVQMLLIRISLLRTLIYLDVGEEKLELHELKKRMVYVMYNFARNIDQNLDFLTVIYNALSEQSMINFDFSPAFIRIYSSS